LSPSWLWSGLNRSRALTHPSHDDPRLKGRTYAIPFARVWAAAVELASGGLWGWSMVEADEDRGIFKAESKTLVFRRVDDVELMMALDEYGQTRVDMRSASRTGRGDLGRNARRIKKFFRVLDKKIGAGPETILDPTRSIFSWAVLVLLIASCGSPEGQPPPGGPAQGEETTPLPRNFQGRTYERHIVFLTSQGDSTLVVPWFFTARTRPGAVDRSIRAWLARSDTWDPFVSETWESPPTRVPWQILPRGMARIIVGQGNALERIFFEEGARRLEVILGELLAEWTGQQAQTFRIHRGATVLSSGQAEGFVLDMSRAWTGEDAPPGDWGFLLSGDSLQMVLEDLSSEGGPQGGNFSAWGRVEGMDRQWERIRLPWSESRPFEPARREVPMSWRILSEGNEISGTLDTVSPFLEVGEGEGPMLPVEALYQVSGTLNLDGRDFPIHGMIRHEQR
jgi:hypothetical protein